jgi:hypothetical protein
MKAVRNENNILDNFNLHISHMYIRQITEKAEYLQKPNDYYNHYYNVENSFNCAVHRDVCIDNPQDYSSSNYYK